MGMGRKRKSGFDLPPRVRLRHGAYHFRMRDGTEKRIASVGQEAEMRRQWTVLYGATDGMGTIRWWLDKYLIEFASDPAKNSPKTYKDKKQQAVYLKSWFGDMPPRDVLPHDVAEYLDTRSAPIRANREKALLSHLFTWLMRRSDAGVTFNPCRGVARNPERARERRIEDREYEKVHALAAPPVKRLMRLIYRTAQRFEDCLAIGPRNVVQLDLDGQPARALRFTQSKTGRTVDVILTGDLEELVAESAKDKIAGMTFVHTRRGQKFTTDGISAMFRRYVAKAELEDFGLRDLRGKAATDMYLAGTSLEKIQKLLGHESVATTERYIKARLPDAVMPNDRAIRAG